MSSRISITTEDFWEDSWITVHGRNANSARLKGVEKKQSVDKSESRKGVGWEELPKKRHGSRSEIMCPVTLQGSHCNARKPGCFFP